MAIEPLGPEEFAELSEDVKYQIAFEAVKGLYTAHLVLFESAELLNQVAETMEPDDKIWGHRKRTQARAIMLRVISGLMEANSGEYGKDARAEREIKAALAEISSGLNKPTANGED